MTRCLQLLRPALSTKSRSCQTTRLLQYPYSAGYGGISEGSVLSSLTRNSDVRKRIYKLQETTSLYPRAFRHRGKLTCRAFTDRFGFMTKEQLYDETSEVILQGRVKSFRIAGSKLVFVDIIQDGNRVQGICNFGRLSEKGVTRDEFQKVRRLLHRGNIISLKGTPYRSKTGELSVLISELPDLLAPCLHNLPITSQDRETRIRKRHTDFLVNPSAADFVRLKSRIVQYIRQYLIGKGHLEVNTPILADGAGGAVARPFQTFATEFPERKLNLRIAPELWLKRMIIGGFDRVFEIGPSFRNEGIDLTHNPEFTTCEFYRAYADLEELIEMTEELFTGLASHVDHLLSDNTNKAEFFRPNFTTPFRRIDFIPAIEEAINRKLPNLSGPNAEVEVADILRSFSIPLPSSMTLPRMLDQLCSIFLEPKCQIPTFIMNQPECLSPLAKSYEHPILRQRVSARAELFVNSQEIVNTYEEENSPIEQRRKFLEQSKFQTIEQDARLDEGYLEALEWGLPPTGGWGCGVERISMLMSGANRIGDVLSFGTLRNVVASGRHL